MLVPSFALLSVPAPLPSSMTSRTEIVSFTPDAMSCADGSVQSSGLVRPLSVVWTRYASSSDVAPPPTYGFSFAIDAQGRVRTIRQDVRSPSNYYFDASDLAPALAVSHFPVGAPHAACSVRYKASFRPIETAAMSDLYELASRPELTGAPAGLFERVRPAGSTCPTQPGQYRRLNLPAFEKLPSIVGGSAWVFYTFDVDKSGKPSRARALGSSGDRALDAAGLHALLANRYAPGPAYRGCTYHFYRTDSSNHEAPELPSDAPADMGDQPSCAVDPKSISGLLNGSAYPKPFSRRHIEGIAVVGYDTAPWGAVGNVKVLLSEPDETFGNVARNGISNARVTENDTGRRGCIQRIRFKLPPTRIAR